MQLSPDKNTTLMRPWSSHFIIGSLSLFLLQSVFHQRYFPRGWQVQLVPRYHWSPEILSRSPSAMAYGYLPKHRYIENQCPDVQTGIYRQLWIRIPLSWLYFQTVNFISTGPFLVFWFVTHTDYYGYDNETGWWIERSEMFLLRSVPCRGPKRRPSWICRLGLLFFFVVVVIVFMSETTKINLDVMQN